MQGSGATLEAKWPKKIQLVLWSGSAMGSLWYYFK